MPDIVDRTTRSRMMSAIKGRDTSPERAIRRALFQRGLRFRLHARGLPGRPDLTLKRFRAAIFVHGCFWHRHKGCSFTTTPDTNAEFWKKKFVDTVARDKRTIRELHKLGWRTCIVWECIISPTQLEATIDEVYAWLHSDRPELVLPASTQKQRKRAGVPRKGVRHSPLE